LRTIWAKLTGANLTPLDFEAVRGDKALRSAQITLPDGTSLAVAIVFGMQQAKKLSDEALAGKSPYHFIEVMNCEGGCIGGGGQPAYEDKKAQALVREHRMAALYRNDRAMPRRQSHENPAIQRLYREFLDEPLSHRAHELLHTHYAPQPS
jgi:iron only hydrogenase large subunit-like protein